MKGLKLLQAEGKVAANVKKSNGIVKNNKMGGSVSLEKVSNRSGPTSTNPFKGNVSRDVMVVDAKGNIVTVKKSQTLTGSPDGKWLQVRDRHGTPTGLRKESKVKCWRKVKMSCS